MNSITLVGRLGADPEHRATPSGKSVTLLKLAVDRGRKDRDGNKQTDWFRVELWEKQAEIARDYCAKGGQVAVSGSIENHRYTDREGTQRDGWKVTARELRLLGSKADASEPQSSAASTSNPPPRAAATGRPAAPPPDFDDDIPF